MVEMKQRDWCSQIPTPTVSSSRISVAPSPVTPEGSSSRRSIRAGSAAAKRSNLAEQTEAGCRRRRTICLPAPRLPFQFHVGDMDNRTDSNLPRCLARAKQIEVDKAKNQLRCSLRVRPEMVEQPDQLQLRIRVRVEPQFDGVVGWQNSAGLRYRCFPCLQHAVGEQSPTSDTPGTLVFRGRAPRKAASSSGEGNCPTRSE